MRKLILAAILGLTAFAGAAVADDTADELAQLKHENALLKGEIADLRAELARVKAMLPASRPPGDGGPPAGPTTRPAELGIVRGRAWFTRGDGTAGSINGMQVTLLKPDVERRTMAAALEAAATAFDQRAAGLRQQADAVREKFPHLAPNNGPWRAAVPGQPAQPPDPGRTQAEEAAKETDNAAAARAIIRTLPDRMSVPEFHKLLGEHSPSAVPDFAQVIASGKIAGTTTDDDGKFTMTDIPAGRGYIYAELIAKRASDWVVGVQIDAGKPAEIKLTNRDE